MNKQPSRVTVRTSIVHEPGGEAAKGWGEPHSFDSQSQELAYERSMTVGEQWQALDLGWVKSPCLVWIKNLPTKFDVMPTDEERAEAAAKVIYLAVERAAIGCLAFGTIQPGRDCQLEPYSGSCWMIRCCKSSCKVQVVAIPS